MALPTANSKPEARQLLRQAGEACHERRCTQSIDLLEGALPLEPSNASIYERLGLCYSGGCCSHPYAKPEVAVAYLRHGLELGTGIPAQFRARLLDTLGNTYVRLRQPAAAIDCHIQAADLYFAAGCREDWAREQFNLGNTWAEMGRWTNAIACYACTLEVRTRRRDPQRWAAVMEHLAWAYREAHDYRRAISCYGRVLRVYANASSPRRKAAVHNALGHTYLCMPGTRHARRALHHLDCALEVRTRAASPADYAATQFNRGHACARLLMAEAAICFEEAQHAFAEAGRQDHAEAARLLRERAAAGLR